MWITNGIVWLGIEKAKIIRGYLGVNHPKQKRKVKKGDVIHLTDAVNGRGYYVDYLGQLAHIDLNYLKKIGGKKCRTSNF